MLDIKSFENSSAQRLSLDFTAHSTACGGRRHELVIFCLNSLRAGEAVDGVGWGGWVGVGWGVTGPSCSTFAFSFYSPFVRTDEKGTGMLVCSAHVLKKTTVRNDSRMVL